MSKSFPYVPIGEFVDRVETWDPVNSTSKEPFSYIDISLVDRDTKKVLPTPLIFPKEAPSRARQLVKANDVIVSTVRPNLNAVAQVQKELDGATASTGFCVLRSNEKKLSSRYLYFWVRSTEFIEEMVKRATGASYPAISDGIIKKSKIPLPPLDEQRRIAVILDKAEAIRRKRQESIRLTEEFLRSTFLDMFGDPVTNPKGWDKIALGCLCTIRRGASPRPISDFLGGTVPWIKIGDATKGNELYLEYTQEKVTEAGANKSVYLEPGSLIFANCGVSLGFARILKIGGCIHDGWLSLEDIKPNINKVFLLKLINSITSYLRRIAPDGTQPNLNTGIMKSLQIITPSIELQNHFENIVHKAESVKCQTLNSKDTIDNLFNSSTHCAFRGELLTLKK